MPGQVFAIFFGFGFTIATCYSAGRILLARLRVDTYLYKQEQLLFAFVTGSACVSLAVFILATIGGLYPAVFVAVGSLLIGFAIRERWPPARALPSLPRLWKWIFVVVFGVYTVLYTAHAMGPEYSPDGSTYHLGYVARYLRQHSFGWITTSIYANLSQGLEMLFLFAFAFGRHSAAAMVHFAFFIALTLGMVAYGRRFAFPSVGVFAAILIYASPVFGFDGTTAYNDVAAACVVFFVFYLLQIWAIEQQDRLLLPIGLLAGFAYAIKYTAAAIVIYAAAFVLWKSKSARRAAVMCAISSVMIAPWMIKNWVVVSNPVSPFMNRLFPNPYVSVAFEREYIQQWTHVDVYNVVQRFLDTTYRSGPTAAILGVVFLLSPVALFAVRSKAGRQLLLVAAVVGYIGGMSIQTRHLLPAVPFVALALGLALMRVPAALPVLILVHAILCWPTVVKHYCDGGSRVRHFLPRQALRIEPEDSTLSYRLPGYRISKMIDRLVPSNGRVLCFAAPPEAYTSRELLIYYESTFNLTAIDTLTLPSVADRQPTLHLSFQIKAQPVHGIRIVQVNENATGQWSAAEIHFFNGADELIRSPRWRLSAKPNPFEIADAFDGNLITRWRSRQTLYRGMRIEVDFGREQVIDRVAIDCSHDQPGIALQLQGQLASGEWSILSSHPPEARTSTSPDLRRAAVEELKRRSITHLLITTPFPGADDMRAHPEEWGLTFLGEVEGTWVYALL